MVSLVWDKRALPLYCFLPKLGSSNLSEQKSSDSGSITVIQGYKVVVLGDREFCSVDLVPGSGTKMCSVLSLKRDEFIQIEGKFGCA